MYHAAPESAPMHQRLATLLTLAGLTLAPQASALGAVFVGKSEATLRSGEAFVVLMRDGTRTVVSMRLDYRGPAEPFAMVVPVPRSVRPGSIKTLQRELFLRIDALSAPRLVETWEQDPCSDVFKYDMNPTGQDASSAPTGPPARLGVEVEGEFVDGEYDVRLLTVPESKTIVRWLEEEGYVVPKSVATALEPYVAKRMKFLVARVGAGAVEFDDRRALLSPLRFHFDSREFLLPTRAGLANSVGTQDLTVVILSKRQRYEVANHANAFLPTNLDVTAAARDSFPELVAALFDETTKSEPVTFVTEHAWDATSCDPCPARALDDRDLATLGADTLSSSTATNAAGSPLLPKVRIGQPEVEGALTKPAVRRGIQKQYVPIRLCYEAAQKEAAVGDRLSVQLVIGKDGEVVEAAPHKSKLGRPELEKCIVEALAKATFPKPARGTVSVSQPIFFPSSLGDSRTVRRGRFVLTRLHARYRVTESVQDLVFRQAKPMSGGRELRDSQLRFERGASLSQANQFQSRYTIRHAWKGPVDCSNPVRGRWGAPPEGTTAPAPRAATHLAQATRKGADPTSFYAETSVEAPPLEPKLADPGPPPASGCDSCALDRRSKPHGWAAGLALVLLVLFRRGR